MSNALSLMWAEYGQNTRSAATTTQKRAGLRTKKRHCSEGICRWLESGIWKMQWTRKGTRKNEQRVGIWNIENGKEEGNGLEMARVRNVL